MVKKYIILFILLYSTISFSDELYTTDNMESIIVRAGIKSLSRDCMYLKAIAGPVFFKYGETIEEIKENEFIKLESKNGKISYKGKTSDEILTAKGGINSIAAISADGKNYRSYRGDFRFVIKENKLFAINNVYIEEYLYGVIPGEIGTEFPTEAIKAQIVAARTYVYSEVRNKIKENYDVTDTTDSQMYLGYGVENKKINELVSATAGEVIVYNGKTINAYYHSTSGGETANIEDVWKCNPVPYLKSIDDSKYSSMSSREEWSCRITEKDISKIMGADIEDISIAEKRKARVYKLSFLTAAGDIIFCEGNDIRKKLGYNKIFSTIFEVIKDGDEFLFKGRGSGHGVGMSQWGAAGMAKKGKGYIDILKFYYTGVDIINLEKM